MRITAEILSKLAKDTAARRTQSDRGIQTVYIHGSLLAGDPVFEGTADVDLFFIYMEEIPERREIVRITDDVHLDIAHHPRSLYRQAKDLRRNPWLGPTIYGSKAIYDPQHFFDFTQASVRAHYNDPENVMARAQWFFERARQGWWSLKEGEYQNEREKASSYLQAVFQAANAVASLSGAPLTIRRFLTYFPERAAILDKPGFYKGLLGLLGAPNLSAEIVTAWLPEWQAAYQQLSGEDVPAKYHPARLNYYLHPFRAMIETERWQTILLPLLMTWTGVIQYIEDDTMLSTWQKVMENIGLGAETAAEKISALDRYLDMVEETLEAWGEKNGVPFYAQ